MEKLKTYRIKKDVDLFKTLPTFGYEYIGNYNRGDNWVKPLDGIDELEPKNGIIIHGDWNNRSIDFRFPYRRTTDNKDILIFISELIKAGLIEGWKENE